MKTCPKRSRDHQSNRDAVVGLALAASIVASWVTVHIFGVLMFDWSAAYAPMAPMLVALQCWLSVGLFIVAHDAMHGSLAPGRPRLCALIGQTCLGLYAGFSFQRLKAKHHAHHRAPGTNLDPDFAVDDATRFWPWYRQFFRTYFHKREFLIVAGLVLVYTGLAGASPINLTIFWAIPALASSVQLFTFGTYLPHRGPNADFVDQHRARSSSLGWLASLLTCFHFGYHHEHHAMPHVPWWRLHGQTSSRTSLPPAGPPAAAVSGE